MKRYSKGVSLRYHGNHTILHPHRSKVITLKDIVTGNPTVIKMVVHFTRSDSGGGTEVLKELLNPLVEEILGKQDLVLNLSPVDVYKSWINQMESDTGEKR